MSSVQCLREFINERLTAAAEEILGVFEKTIIDYEKEINRQRKLLAIVWKPRVKLQRTELPQQYFLKAKEIQNDQQPCNQGKDSVLEEEALIYQHIKEEHEDIYTSVEDKTLVLKEETNTLLQILTSDGGDHSVDPASVNPNESQNLSAADEKCLDMISVKSSETPEPSPDCPLLLDFSHLAEKPDNRGGKHRAMVLTGNVGTTQQTTHHKTVEEHNHAMLETPFYTHTGKRLEFRCDTCGKVFPYKSKLIRHLRIHTGVKPYCCSICGKRFNQTSILKVHQRIHTGERPYACDICGKRFNQKSILNVHKKTHSIERPYSCDICRKRFNQKSKLEAHIIWHTELPQQCIFKEEDVFIEQQLCNQERNSVLDRKDLMSPQIKEEQEVFCTSQDKGQLELKAVPDTLLTLPCDEEEHTVAQTLYLDPAGSQSASEEESIDIIPDYKRVKQAVKRNHKSKVYNPNMLKTPFNSYIATKSEYKCDTCGKTFKFRSRLIRHLRIHTGVKPYCCHICGKRFNQKSILQVHQRIHTGEKPYACDMCGKRFNQKSILNVHKRIHTGERPYSCETCGKRFTQKSILNGHKIIHTGEKPYSCQTCGKCLRSHSNLLVHMRKHIKREGVFL